MATPSSNPHRPGKPIAAIGSDLGVGRLLRGAWGRLVHLPRTPAIPTTHGEARLTRVVLGGAPQWVLVRGQDRRRPVLLFLHGGPGMPAMYLAHRFQAALERDFLVVHWDRYGAGKSWAPPVDRDRLKTTCEVDDAVELIAWLQAEYDCGPMFVVGHSYGAYLAVTLALRAPEQVRGLIGVGLMTVSHAQEAAAQDVWLGDQARARNDPALLRRLAGDRAWDRSGDVFRFGGGVVGLESPFALGALALGAPEYSLFDMVRLAGGIRAAHRGFAFDGPALPLVDSVSSLAVPLYALMGRWDRITSIETVRPWFDALTAPRKIWIEFQHSAHLPFLEEPERFAAVLRDIASNTGTL